MFRQLFEAVFPPQCGACARLGTGACDRCLPRVPPLESRLPTLHVQAVGAYDGPVRYIVLALKKGRRDVARSLGERLCELVEPCEIVVPVPTTAARRRERGFDGCTLMARIAAQKIGCGVLDGLVQIAGDRQRGRDRDARLAARGRFRWRGAPLCGIRIVLLDDVVTTGATLEDCAHTLRAAGASVERAVAVAMA